MSEKGRRVFTENLLLDEINTSRHLIRKASNANQEKIQIQKTNIQLQEQLQETENELHFYKNLLTKPMQEIAQHDKNFAETYRLQQEMLADWMVSQKAFKELAIEFGGKLGKTPTEVIESGINKKIDVLENKHDNSHKTNAKDSELLEYHKNNLINKIIKK